MAVVRPSFEMIRSMNSGLPKSARRSSSTSASLLGAAGKSGPTFRVPASAVTFVIVGKAFTSRAATPSSPTISSVTRAMRPSVSRLSTPASFSTPTTMVSS